MLENVKIKINDQNYSLNVESRLLLVDLIRKKLKLTGTHVGCDTSQCGSCVVFLDGKCVKSCSVLAAQCNGKSVKTIEGIGEESNLHNIQKAFKKYHGLQCGFCTPGIIMTALEIKKIMLLMKKLSESFLMVTCVDVQDIKI